VKTLGALRREALLRSFAFFIDPTMKARP